MSKWLCVKCNAINPLLAPKCHACGEVVSYCYTSASNNAQCKVEPASLHTDNQESRIAELEWQVANWERKEIDRASCCFHNEQQVSKFRAVLELIAAPVRADGTYNRGREACEQLAGAALTPINGPVVETSPVVGTTPKEGDIVHPGGVVSDAEIEEMALKEATTYYGMKPYGRSDHAEGFKSGYRAALAKTGGGT